MKLSKAISTFLLVIAFSSLGAGTALAADTTSDVDSDFEALGANQAILNRAKNLEGHNKMMVVQKRAVDRNLRLELGVSYGANAVGDSYLNTQILGGELDFHITPRWSIGGRYYGAFNQLTPEGRNVFDQAQAAAKRGENYQIPDLDYPVSTWLAVLDWYPIYGKTNLLDIGIAQFDFYTLAGAGQVQLSSGPAPTVTAGGGIGIWINNHLTTRFELRWQNYQDQVYSGSRQLNLVVANATIGFLL